MTHRYTAVLVTSALVLSSSIGCADDFMLERTQKNIARMRAFRGILVEKGVLASGEMRSEVLFKRPSQFISRVLAPESYAGVTLAYDGRRMTVYYPKANYAVQFDNLIPPTPDDERRLIADAYRHNQATFRYSLGGSGTVARLPVVELKYKAKEPSAMSPWGVTQVYDKYSFALAGVMQLVGNSQYEFHFEEMKFDEPADDARFALPLPKNVVLSRWDLSSPGLPEQEMREQANFELSLPRVPTGFQLERIVRQEGPVPAFTLVYRRGAQFLLLSVWKDLGLRATSEPHGVPVTLGAQRGHVVIGPTVSTYSTSHRGTMYVLIGNVPFDQILEVASEIH
jgi:hypothetical protein